MSANKKLTAIEVRKKAKIFFAKAKELEKKENEKIGKELKKIFKKDNPTIEEIRELVK
ncbi:MAG: hypothetical protein ABIN05_07925 [candidate division WOR-3 bacterium]